MTKFKTLPDSGVSDGMVLTPPTSHAPGIDKEFLFAGKAHFLTSNPVGDHYEFGVNHRGVDKKSVYHLNVRTEGGKFPYRFVGVINPHTGVVIPAGKTEFLPGTREYDVGQWAVFVVLNGTLLEEGYDIKHIGKCGRCNGVLSETNTETIAYTPTGFHPDCWASHVADRTHTT